MPPTPSDQPDPAARPASPDASGTSLLIVDDEPTARQMLADALAGPTVAVHAAATLAEARQIAQSTPIDVVIVGAKLSDGNGLTLAGELKQNCPALRSIVVTGRRSYQGALEAMRAGASDYLAKPFDAAELSRCLKRVMWRRAEEVKQAEKVERLHKLCRELTQAKHAMGRRVGALCNDLTTAYRDLAGQVRHAQLIGRFKAAVEQELDLERVLRRFLEVVLHEVGPTNAVVFLPSTAGSFAVGGYINYDLEKGGLELMLEHLSDTAAPALASCDGPRCLKGDKNIRKWLGSESRWLEGKSLLVLPCRDRKELLAGLLLFRNGSEPYETATAEALDAIAPILAAHLTKVVHIHHRLRPNDQALDHGDGTDPDEMKF